MSKDRAIGKNGGNGHPAPAGKGQPAPGAAGAAQPPAPPAAPPKAAGAAPSQAPGTPAPASAAGSAPSAAGPSVRQVPCPICGKLSPWQGNPARPFCSDRCRLMDLGQWADGTYAIPAEPVPDKGEDEE